MNDVTQTSTRLWGWVVKYGPVVGVVITIVVVGLFTIFVVKPFPPPTPASDDNDVAVQWNASIARLGITPVFPPQEDFHVGDVLAVVAQAGPTKQAVLGRAVFLGHIDLQDEITKAASALPVFADTAALATGDEYRRQDSAQTPPAPSDGKIRLTLLAFPGVSISHVTRSGSAGGAGLFGFGAGRNETIAEELRIPTAETYGVQPSIAAVRLLTWCADAATKLLCTDAFARRMLAFTLGDEVLDSVGGVYTSTLELQIITRVYMTRTIEQRRLESGSRALTILRGANKGAANAPAGEKSDATTPEGRARDTVSAQQNAVDAASTIESGATLKTASADSTEFQLQQTFQRPLVFGFRSWNKLLKP